MNRHLRIACLALVALVALAPLASADPGRGATVLCYVWANNPSTSSYSPSSTYSYNLVGRASANVVTRSGVGQYNVTCQGVGGGAFFKQDEAGEESPASVSTEAAEKIGGDDVAPQAGTSWSFGGHVQVTAYGSDSNYCKVTSWGTGGRDFSAGVRCFTSAGVLADTRFDLLFVW